MGTNFDPDAYLAATTPSKDGFNPDAYLAATDPGFDPSKANKNVVPDIKGFLTGLMGTVKEGALDMPGRALSSGVQMAGGVPYAETPSGQRDTSLVENAPDQAATMVRPLTHPIRYAEEHPVSQILNVIGLLSGLSGLKGATAATAGEGAAAAAGDTIGQRVAARTTAQALDLNPLAVRKLAMKSGTSPEQVVLDLGNKAHELIPDLIKPLDTANTKFSKIMEAHDAAGSEIGNIVKGLGEGAAKGFPEAQETINALKTAAKEYDGVDGGDMALQKTADRLEALQKDGKLDFERLSKMKSNIGKGFSKTEIPAGTEDIYDILNNGIGKVVDRLSVNDPAIGPQLAHLKNVYTVTSRLLPAMSRTAAKEVAGASLGSGILSKAIPSAIGGLIGGPFGALAGVGAKYAQEVIAPDLTKNLAYMAMKSAPEIPAAVSQVPIASAIANNIPQTPQSSMNIQDLIQQLKAKYDARRKF